LQRKYFDILYLWTKWLRIYFLFTNFYFILDYLLYMFGLSDVEGMSEWWRVCTTARF
jgi:hypothetical protein